MFAARSFLKSKPMKIAFIGLGIMGTRMASNLLANGVELTVQNRSPEPVDELVKKGAHRTSSPAEAVQDADIVFSMLSTPEVVEKVFLGKEGVLGRMKEGAIWADHSTVDPSFSKRCGEEAEASGVSFLDAPVSGSKPQAENAELIFLVGGDEGKVEIIRPYVEMMGKRLLHAGELGKGSSFKMVVNMMLAQSMLAFSEATLFGESLGISEETLLNELPNMVVSAPLTVPKAEKIRNAEYDPQFPLEWMHKDLHLASNAAYEAGRPIHLANLAKEIYAEADHGEMSRMDFSAIFKYLKERR
jgi:3-hydroxyisobutyrate dehydrogenase-like beta-hydroxyacid dehydrogenase